MSGGKVSEGRYSLTELYDIAFDFAKQAKDEDKRGNKSKACTFYREAAHWFLEVLTIETDAKKKKLVSDHVENFLSRTRQLQGSDRVANVEQALAEVHLDAAEQSPEAELLSRAAFVYDQAHQADDDEDVEQAVGLYREAAKYYLDALDLLKKNPAAADIDGDVDSVSSITQRIEQILTRTADLKRLVAIKSPGRTSTRHKSGADLLTDHEKAVLRVSSTVNGKLYYPWMEHDVLEKFSFREAFIDPDGVLALSDKQRAEFVAWKRPRDLNANPRMIDVISPYTIKQTLITDCSFVAAISVAAYYERRHRKKLITNVIFPQDRSGRPLYNPDGKYMIKMIVNGIARKVIVDDRLPVGLRNIPLCSFSNNPGEMWVSIVEKAFLKVMGGYQFPGSNGGNDLHVLTGWIPERIGTQSDDFNKDRTWERMLNAHNVGDCLVTASTGSLNSSEEDATGLVSNHAYAVLQIKQMGSVKLLQLKNPWSRIRWKGPYGPDDDARWTPALRRAFDYDQATAAAFDNGIFWIDYDSLCQYYRSVYLNWNPELFEYRCTVHDCWPKDRGPRQDLFNREYCPQYELSVVVPDDQKSASVWILLSKHSTEKKEEDDEYITVHVYSHDAAQPTQPGLVYYSDGPLVRGTYINNAHDLCRMDVASGRSTYRIVVSQYEKAYDLSYTLNVFCTARIALRRIVQPYKCQTRVGGEWSRATAGGSPNNTATYLRNPQFELVLSKPTALLFKVEAPKDYSVNVTAFKVQNEDTKCTGGKLTSMMSYSNRVSQTPVADTGAYRHGFACVEVSEAELCKHVTTFPCKLTILVSTFHSGQEGPFFLTVGSPKYQPILNSL